MLTQTEKIFKVFPELCDSSKEINCKVEKILRRGLDSIPSPSPSVKIQIIGGKFTEGEGDGIKSRLPLKFLSTP